MKPANTREEWLHRVATELFPVFAEFGFKKVPPMKFSCGFTSKGVRSKRIGECHSTHSSAVKVHEIFVHPMLSDPLEVAQVAAHEMIHAFVGLEAKHGGKFKAVAVKLGLAGKMTATFAGAGFITIIKPVLARVGAYPHGALSMTLGTRTSSGPKQKTKMLKVECPECEYTCRTTQKWLDIAVPKCPDKQCSRYGRPMEQEIKDSDAEREDNE